MHKIQTTYTFLTEPAANLFVTWLRKNDGDHNYGNPKFLHKMQVSDCQFCVEYGYDEPLARGVAIGIDFALDSFESPRR